MMLSDLLGPEQILIDLQVNNKAQLLQELSRRAAAAIGIDGTHILEILQARENLGSTGLGKVFALPHARLESIETPFALLARLAKPIDFDAIDERPVDLVILLLTPSNRPNAHLSMLAQCRGPCEMRPCSNVCGPPEVPLSCGNYCWRHRDVAR
jgi:nitrogen PTS system EIIA component